MVQEFNADNNLINSSLHSEWGNMKSLVELQVRHNDLRGTIPPSLGKMRNLRVFDLRSNSVEGAVPAELHGWTSMSMLRLSNNPRLAGAVAHASWTQLQYFESRDTGVGGDVNVLLSLPKLQYADINGCLFNGTLPSTMYSKTYLRLRQNRIVGHFPVAPKSGSLTTHLYIDNNPLTGGLHEIANLHKLQRFEASSCQLSGPMPPALIKMPELSFLDVSHNQLSGPLPRTFNESKLRILVAKHNSLSGAVPAELGLASTMQKLDLSHNQLTGGTSNPEFRHLTSIGYIDLSNNKLSQDLTNLIVPLLFLRFLGVLNLANNNIHGGFENWPEDQAMRFLQPLVTLNLAYNNLSSSVSGVNGIEDYVKGKSLTNVDLSNNPGLHGEMQPGYEGLLVGKFSGTNLRSRSGRLPSFLRLTGSYVKSQDGVYSCPELRGPSSSSTFEVDPEYYGRSLCVCEPGYYGKPSTGCNKCLEGTICPGGYGYLEQLVAQSGSTSLLLQKSTTRRTAHKADRSLQMLYNVSSPVVVKPGNFPLPFPAPGTADGFISWDGIKKVVKCRVQGDKFPACNPKASDNFECAAGYKGRLCSRCDVKFYQRGGKCLSCPSTGLLQVRLLGKKAARPRSVAGLSWHSRPASAFEAPWHFVQLLNRALFGRSSQDSPF